MKVYVKIYFRGKLARSAGNGYAKGVEVRAQRQFFGWVGVFRFYCFLATYREMLCGLPGGQDAKILPMLGTGAIAHKKIFSFSFFAPFNAFFFETNNSFKTKQNKQLTKKLCLKSILRLSAGLVYRLYNI